MVRGKKGQAVLEYVHTYGWVLLAMVMIGGVLLYFNVTKAQQFVPLECSFLSGLSCLDAEVEDSFLSISVVNEFGFVLSNVSVNITGTCNSTANTTDGNPYGNLNVLLENQQARYVFECQNLTNMKLAERVVFSYRSLGTAEQHLKYGRLHYSPVG
ncbi:hypothetical protein KY363_05065 [Candidatus Woesearchaeota archaeon]|nr:hypothetical protein [Candidatus Woesearchaeota archaeon]